MLQLHSAVMYLDLNNHRGDPVSNSITISSVVPSLNMFVIQLTTDMSAQRQSHFINEEDISLLFNSKPFPVSINLRFDHFGFFAP